jgi:hypothetical protein
MLNLRIVQSLVFAVALLLGQQGGAMHALRHALAEQAQQRDKQTSAPHDCEQCLSYAQLGSALNVGFLSFDLCDQLVQAITQHQFFFLNRHTLPALARGPPSLQSPV